MMRRAWCNVLEGEAMGTTKHAIIGYARATAASAAVVWLLAAFGCSKNGPDEAGMPQPPIINPAPGSAGTSAMPVRSDSAGASAAGDQSSAGASAAGGQSSAGAQAAGGSSGAGGSDTVDPSMDIPPGDGYGSDGRITEACMGFPLVGLMYSPGGSALPNKCAPFNPFTNNPYAIRCIEAMPHFETPYAGDEFCILPPAPDKGFQVGVHPQGWSQYWQKMWAGDYSDYSDPAKTADYELAAGGETVQSYTSGVDATAGTHFYRVNFRGRYGSHHTNLHFTGAPFSQESWPEIPDFLGDLGLGGVEIARTQRPNSDTPLAVLEIPAEERGLGYALPPETGEVSFQMHHFNATGAPILRELWVNAWYIPAAEVTTLPRNSAFPVGVEYPPNQVIDNEGVATANGETRILSMYGHRHAWTPRFHAWVVRAGSTERTLVYDSYDWFDMPTFSYNSSTANPAPGLDGVDGAFSGPLMMQAGDALHFNCHADTTAGRAAELGVDPPTTTLRFANEAFTAEMCVLRTMTTGTPLGGGL
jgi:hypothetical protein